MNAIPGSQNLFRATRFAALSKTAIFTLNWNGEPSTRRLLQSLSSHCRHYSIFVFDNGSESIPADEFKSTLPSVQFVRIAGNHGFAGGVNLAIAHLSAEGFDFAYEINNDCVVSNDPVAACLDVIARRPNVRLVGSRFLSGPDFEAFTATGEKGRFSSNQTAISGCAMLLDCRVFLQLGGLDERFFCYHEELEYCIRLQESGHEIASCPESIVGHYHEGSDFRGNAVYYRTRNAFLLKKKHPRRTSVLYHCAMTLSRPWHCILSDPEQWKAWAQGVRDGILGKWERREKEHGTILFFALFLAGSVALAPVLCASRISRFMKRRFVSLRR